MANFAGVKFPFGKYKGRTIKWVSENDLPYLIWFSSNIKTSGIIKYAADHYMESSEEQSDPNRTEEF